MNFHESFFAEGVDNKPEGSKTNTRFAPRCAATRKFIEVNLVFILFRKSIVFSRLGGKLFA